MASKCFQLAHLGHGVTSVKSSVHVQEIHVIQQLGSVLMAPSAPLDSQGTLVKVSEIFGCSSLIQWKCANFELAGHWYPNTIK